MVTFYPDVSCWAWAMADGVDQPDVAERQREVPDHLAAGRDDLLGQQADIKFSRTIRGTTCSSREALSRCS
jgi:hypothetical protein